jgi:hypothetical protein
MTLTLVSPVNIFPLQILGTNLVSGYPHLSKLVDDTAFVSSGF